MEITQEIKTEEVISIDGCRIVLRFPSNSKAGVLEELKGVLFRQENHLKKLPKICNKTENMG